MKENFYMVDEAGVRLLETVSRVVFESCKYIPYAGKETDTLLLCKVGPKHKWFLSLARFQLQEDFAKTSSAPFKGFIRG